MHEPVTFIIIELMKLLWHFSEGAYDILLLLLYVPHIWLFRVINKKRIITTGNTSGIPGYWFEPICLYNPKSSLPKDKMEPGSFLERLVWYSLTLTPSNPGI